MKDNETNGDNGGNPFEIRIKNMNSIGVFENFAKKKLLPCQFMYSIKLYEKLSC